MRPAYASSFLAGAVLFLATGAIGADAVKLTPLVSIVVDEKSGEIKTPEGVACNERKQFIIADTGNGRLLRYYFKEEGIAGGTEIKVPQLPSPVRVQFGPGGDIYALDGQQRRIVHLNPDGVFTGYLEARGLPGDAPVIPRSFRIDSSGNAYLLDIFGERVIQLDPSGTFKRQIPFPAGHGFCSDLALDSRGGILLLDSTKAVVYSLPREGAAFAPLSRELRDYASFPVSLALDSRGTIYLADRNSGGIVIIGPDGSYQGRQLSTGQKSGMLSYPGQICFDNRDALFIADTGNNRVQLFSTGK